MVVWNCKKLVLAVPQKWLCGSLVRVVRITMGQFKDDQTNKNIRAELDQGKQRVIAPLADRLSQSISEQAIIETLRTNLLWR